MARDSYSILHLPMVAGIVLVALGMKKTLGDVEDPLKLVPATALLGGAALYLLAHVAFRYRHIRTLNTRRLTLSVLLVAFIAVAVQIPALATISVLALALALRIVPSSTSKRSSCSGCTCAPGTRPSAASSSSSRFPAVSAAARRNVMRSPLTGLSMICPARAMVAPSRAVGRLCCDQASARGGDPSSAALTIGDPQNRWSCRGSRGRGRRGARPLGRGARPTGGGACVRSRGGWWSARVANGSDEKGSRRGRRGRKRGCSGGISIGV
jgi:hypothetical protein